MNILVVQLGNQCECLISTSVIKKLSKHNPTAHIYCIVKNQETKQIFQYNKRIKNVYIADKTPNELYGYNFDTFINLHPDFSLSDINKINAKNKFGFHCSEKSQSFYDILYGNKKTNKNIFQIYFGLSGLKWAGDGFDVNYYPKSRTKKYISGISIANANLRNYIINRLKLDNSKLWCVPYKQNLFSKMDEINKCGHIITDDFFTLNISLSLKKNVYFLQTIPFNTKLELFGSGEIFEVPKNIIQ